MNIFFKDMRESDYIIETEEWEDGPLNIVKYIPSGRTLRRQRGQRNKKLLSNHYLSNKIIKQQRLPHFITNKNY